MIRKKTRGENIAQHIKVVKGGHRKRKLAQHGEEKGEKGCTKIKQEVEEQHGLNDKTQQPTGSGIILRYLHAGEKKTVV